MLCKSFSNSIFTLRAYTFSEVGLFKTSAPCCVCSLVKYEISGSFWPHSVVPLYICYRYIQKWFSWLFFLSFATPCKIIGMFLTLVINKYIDLCMQPSSFSNQARIDGFISPKAKRWPRSELDKSLFMISSTFTYILTHTSSSEFSLEK